MICDARKTTREKKVKAILNRATRNFDIKTLRRILADAVPDDCLYEEYRSAGLVPGGMDPRAFAKPSIIQALATHFFKSEEIRESLAKALQRSTAVEAVRIGQLDKTKLEELAFARREVGKLAWVLGTHEDESFQQIARDLLKRRGPRPHPNLNSPPPNAQKPDPAKPAPQHFDGRVLYRKNRRLQTTIKDMQKELEKLKTDRQRGEQESEELRQKNANLENRLRQMGSIESLRERLAQVETEKEHVIYELNRKTHELYQLQKKYEIFNGLDTEVLILRSKLAKILNDAIVERRRFAEEISAISEANRRALDFYLQEKELNLGRGEKPADQVRVGVFVDVQNMFYAARNKFNGRLDYQALLKAVSCGRKITTANAYIIQTPDIDQSNFILLLEHCGYKIHSKYLRTRYDGSAKGDWDMEIAIDIISMIGQLDVVSLISGDGDFVALVRMVQRHGLEVEVHSFEHNTAIDLREAANHFYPINEELILQ